MGGIPGESVMPARPHSILLPLLIAIGAFALGGCDDEEELTDAGTLVIDDDRTSGLPMTVYIALGSQTPSTIQVDFGTTRYVSLAQGTYTITFDDNGTSGIQSGDTVETGVQVLTDLTVTIEYVAPGDAEVYPQANG
jgi:hypothetical protein